MALAAHAHSKHIPAPPRSPWCCAGLQQHHIPCGMSQVGCFPPYQTVKMPLSFPAHPKGLNRVVSGEPGGNNSIRYPLLYHHPRRFRHCQSPEDPTSLLSIANTELLRSQLGPPCSVLFSLPVTHTVSCSSSFLLLPFPSCSHYSCTRQLPPPTSPHAKSLHLMPCSHLLGYSQHHVPKIHQAERL